MGPLTEQNVRDVFDLLTDKRSSDNIKDLLLDNNHVMKAVKLIKYLCKNEINETTNEINDTTIEVVKSAYKSKLLGFGFSDNEILEYENNFFRLLTTDEQGQIGKFDNVIDDANNSLDDLRKTLEAKRAAGTLTSNVDENGKTIIN